MTDPRITDNVTALPTSRSVTAPLRYVSVAAVQSAGYLSRCSTKPNLDY
jgi:hypothetical protein